MEEPPEVPIRKAAGGHSFLWKGRAQARPRRVRIAAVVTFKNIRSLGRSARSFCSVVSLLFQFLTSPSASS